MYWQAYGSNGMTSETRDTLLHGQLEEGLVYELTSAPAVSGAQSYCELCLATRNEERRLVGLGRWRQYRRSLQSESNLNTREETWTEPPAR